MKLSRIIFTAMCVTLSLSIMAGDLKAPFDFPSASTLPKGVRNLRYKGAWVQGTDRYNNSGNAEPLGSKINSPITVEKVLDGESNVAKRAQLAGYLKGSGFSDDDVLGFSSGEVNVAANVHAPIFAYGVTKKLTMAVAIPIIESRTSVDSGFISQGTIDEIKSKLHNQTKAQKVEDLVRNINRPVQKKLEDYGYEPLENEHKTELGDIKLVSKYRVRDRDLYTISLTSDLTLPTGKEVPVDNVVGVPSGDGQLDVGFGVITDYRVSDKLTFSHSAGFVIQLKDTTDKRVPRRGDTALTPDKENNLNRDLGDKLYNNFAASYNVWHGLYAKGGYSFQYKGRDSYSGTKFSEQRYNWMEVDTEQNMHAIITGMTFSTVQLYKRGLFAVPMETSLTYSTVVAGKNVVKNPLVSFEMVMFF